jgi:hypothetical protein
MKTDDSEIVMVQAADYALDCIEKNPSIMPEEIISDLIRKNKLRASTESKVFGIAAVNEILVLKKQNRHMSRKQLLQALITNRAEFMKRVRGEEE